MLDPCTREMLHKVAYEDVPDAWRMILDGYEVREQGVADLGRADRWFLVTYILGKQFVWHPWVFDRCREVEADPDDYLDIWAREHFKTTLITFAGILQEIILNPEITIGIFSHTRPVAKKFLIQLRAEIEQSERLRMLYPDVFWADPRRDAGRSGAKWSEERFDLKRTSNPREGTVEAWGLVDGQPTGSHFLLRVYDDVVTRESVTTPEQADKTTEAWELSDNLGARGPDGKSRRWHIGTRYSFRDTYQHIIDKKILKPRIHPATIDGQMDGTPVLFPPAVWTEKKITQGPAVVACQLLCNPAAGNEAMFKKEWIRYQDVRAGTLNIYIIGDPASSKKKGSDCTAIPVIAVDANRNKLLIDGFCHKMDLRERWLAIRELRRTWMNRPGIQGVWVGYERYGMQSDLEYFEEQMELDKDGFEIREINWTKDGTKSKVDRIQRLTPDFSRGSFYLTSDETEQSSNQKRMEDSGQSFRILKPIRKRDHEGKIYSLNQKFMDEFCFFPFSTHDDLIDAMSRIYDMDYNPPVLVEASACEPEVE